jgi:hypothetical protein
MWQIVDFLLLMMLGKFFFAKIMNILLKAALSNLVAIRHMWRKEILMWRQTVIQKWISNGKYAVFLTKFD